MSDLTNTFRVFFQSSSFRASGLIAAFTFLICLVAAQSAQAQLTLTVTRTDDRNTTCNSGVDCSLREAVNAANAATTKDTINFAIPAGNAGCTSGVCTITLTSGNLVVNSAATTGTLTIRNTTGASNLRISGNYTSRVFSVNSSGNLTINGVTITNGRTTGNGGGISNRGTLTLTNSTVSGNRAFDGGGIFNIGTMTLTNSTVSGNTADFFGGGIVNNGGTVTLTNSTVSGNTAINDLGGGIFNSGGGTMTLTNSTLSGNRSGIGGGGIVNEAIMMVTNSTVSGNTAGNGGGIFNFGGITTLTNSTVSGNTASSLGGGILNNGGTLNLTSVTVTNNRSTDTGCTDCAGGINNFSSSTTNLKNTIVAGNTAANASSSPDFRGAVTAGSSFNLIGNGLGTTGITNTNGNQVGTSANPINPLLAPLANNGGQTQTHALLVGSPAIDAGSNDLASGAFDQRGTGFPRIVDGNGDGTAIVDIGAYEVQAAPTAATVSVSGRVTTAQGRGIRNVVVTMTDSIGNTRTAMTTSFGYYRFEEVAAGETYIFAARGKRFSFEQNTQVHSIMEDTNNINFVADNQSLIPSN